MRYTIHISLRYGYYNKVTLERKPDTRQALLDAAAELISAAPGQDIPLRAICDAVGVKLPTLYHFFGNKEGLLDAVIEHGFDLYLDVKESHESSGDPIQDIRDGWDAHVAFGLANPGFYALMYGQVTPGTRPSAQQRPTDILFKLASEAARQGRLATDAGRAVDQILAANVGVTLYLIAEKEPDLELSSELREATLAGITGEGITGTAHGSDIADSPATGKGAAAGDHPASRAALAGDLLRALGSGGTPLDDPEATLLKKWLHALSAAD